MALDLTVAEHDHQDLYDLEIDGEIRTVIADHSSSQDDSRLPGKIFF